jgi:TPR repeat protein
MCERQAYRITVAGRLKALGILALVLTISCTNQDEATSLKTAASAGDPAAQYEVGFHYEVGQGVNRSRPEAIKWYKLAADQGYEPAKTSLWAMDVSSRSAPALIIPGPSVLATAVPQTASATSVTSVGLKISRGTFQVPVTINDAIVLDFTVDSGASVVTIPADVVLTLMNMGTITETDFLGQQMYVLADGSQMPSHAFRIRSLKVGDRTVENVTGSIVSVQGGLLLLGQSFLGGFESWSIDNRRHVLILQ